MSLFYLLLLLLFSSQLQSTVTVHQVGAGNCVTFEDPSTETYMLIDCGTSEYAKSLNPQLYLLKPPSQSSDTKHSDRDSPPTPVRASSSAQDSPPHTVHRKRQSSPKVGDDTGSLSRSEAGKKKAEAIEQIRKSLGASATGKRATVKTVFVTHPDVDHYRWIPEVLKAPVADGDGDTVEHIVLGGDPLKYDANETFKDWIVDYLKKGATLHLLALNKESRVIGSVDAYERVIQSLERKENIWGAYKSYTKPSDNLEFLKMNPRPSADGRDPSSFQITLLGLNTLHFETARNSIFRATYLDDEGGGDDNADSYMLKIVNTANNASILLTGDATGLNTRRLLHELSRDDDDGDGDIGGGSSASGADGGGDDERLNLVSSTVLLASHHGAESHGSNHLTWLRRVNPSWILISSGVKNGHPTETVYERFTKLPSLQNKTDSHTMLSAQKEKIDSGRTKYTFFIRETSRPVLSTLANGTFEVSLINEKHSTPGGGGRGRDGVADTNIPVSVTSIKGREKETLNLRQTSGDLEDSSLRKLEVIDDGDNRAASESGSSPDTPKPLDFNGDGDDDDDGRNSIDFSDDDDGDDDGAPTE